MRRSIRFFVPLVTALWIAACGGNGGGGNDSGNGNDGSVTNEAGGNDGGTGMDGTVGNDGSVNHDGSIIVADGSTDDSGIVIVGNMVLCGGHACQCSDGIDNDGDGLTDNQDPECVSPYDDDESSFATGIPGDNMGSNAATECFFDGNSGTGNDTNCVVPNGCDCRGCCAFDIDRNGTHEKVNIRDASCHTVTLNSTPDAEGGPCTPDTDGGPGSCTDAADHCLLDGDGVTYFCAPCSTCLYANEETPPVSGCETNPCTAGETCLGDMPGTPGDGGTSTDGGSTPACASGVTSCTVNSDCSGLGSSYFCITGCCYNLG